MRTLIGCLCLATAVAWLPAVAAAQTDQPIAGAWSLNRSLSEMPREIGFNPGAFPGVPEGGGGSNGGGGGGGRGGRRGSTGGSGAAGSPFSGRLESYDESRRVQLLTNEARNPSSRLVIVDSPPGVTITNELGQSRTLHPNVRDESIEVEGVRLIANTHHDGGRLIVSYFVAQGREVRYTYSRAEGSPQLVVEVEFIERGTTERARRIYDPGVATTRTADTPDRTSSPPLAPPPSAPEPPAVPASPQGAAPPNFDSRPGAELRGLKTLGILVEDLSPQAVGCGLSHDALETALGKRLTDDGFTVRRNSDDDTYVYINVMTTTLAGGICASRYDAFLYTHATANLSYRDRPVLVQVSLMHRGGMGTSAPGGHGAAVTRGLEEYIDLIATQIRDANKQN